MRCNFIKTKGTWRDIANSAILFFHNEEGIKEPSSLWKKRMLLCEHSPTRQLLIKAKWYDLMYWVSVHLVRHKFGIEHWVRTQRTDRTEFNRNNLPQGSLVEHEIEVNAQSIINISRRRLCNSASKETREAWKEFLNSFKENQQELFNVCVPDCIYRGWCYEFKSCGYHKTDDYKKKLEKYRENINI